MMTYLGMGVMILGVIVIIAGSKLVGAIMTLSGMLIGIGANPAKDMPNGSPTMVMLGFVLLAGSVFFLVKAWKAGETDRKKAARVANEQIGATDLDKFFVECVLARLNDFTQKKNVEKAKKLAQKYNLEYPYGIEALYLQGFNEHKVVSRRFYFEKVEKERAKERERKEELDKYADLTGKEKRITMLQEMAAEHRKSARDKRDVADMMMRSGQQREASWAIMGGIADGIAGPGAGVATAIDTQLRNAQIREENAARLQAAMPAVMHLDNSAGQSSKQADKIAKEIEEFNMKLMSDDTKETLLEKITFSDTHVGVSNTGAATVKTTASLKTGFKIFGDVPAVVDGTLLANIYEGDELCGTAQLVLPLYGVGKDVPLKGMCLDCCEKDKEYTVKFEAKNLCAIEK